jgi:hypothetical protein
MNCPSCGAAAGGNDTFCGSCGARLDDGAGGGEEAATQTVAVEASPAPPRATRPPPRPPRRPSPRPARPPRRPPSEKPSAGELWAKTVPEVAPQAIDGEPESLPGAGLDAVTGEAVPNTTYLGQRLLYEKPAEASFDPLAGSAYLLELLKHALLFVVIWWFGLSVVALLAYAAQSTSAAATLFFLWSGALALVFWLVPIPVLLSEWKFAIDGKGEVGPRAFEHIIWALRRRQTPLEVVRVRRIALPRHHRRDYLELRSGLFAGFVSCFPYGRDLYIGWTFWWYFSPLRFIWLVVTRYWQTLALRGSQLYTTLRYDSAKAMREAMHGAAREGIDVAAGYVAPQGQGTIGTEISVATAGVPRSEGTPARQRR